ncbi:MAG: hypothetical protein ABJC63_08090, partial [Gemmatimonadales bacterium]
MKTLWRALMTVGVIAIGDAACGQSTRLGTIYFPTAGSDAAQPHFIRGVLFLHSFEYDAAAAEFVKAQRADPSFAMAYWGEAMTYTHPVWDEQDTTAAKKALRKLAGSAAERRAKTST